MRNLQAPDINQYRDKSPNVVAQWGHIGDASSGAFFVPSRIDGQMMRVIASVGDGWDHVSVSRKTRCPTWPEMEHIRRLFLGDVTAMQLHLSKAEHINCHPYCLHIWMPLISKIPVPPQYMVG